MIPHRNIAAVVVLYNPGLNILDNILSYVDTVAAVYVVDNSDVYNRSVVVELQKRRNIIYLNQGGNKGIAHALNRAVEKAFEHGYDLLLTLDQDSCPFPGMIDVLLSCHAPGVGVVAPLLQADSRQMLRGDAGCHPVMTAMTSGSLLNLAAYKKAGLFRDDFFIDFVDVEYCLRLHRHGYKVLQADNAHLEHHVGTRIGPGAWLSVTTHVPLRKYYKTRNRLQVWGEYGRTFPGYVRRDRIRFVLELIRLILFEPEKKAKMGMMWRGWRDFRQGKFGRYEEQG